ncbi:hypothetical protein ADP71_17380 [Vitreoscilla sp. C1]|uniref:hypothetical protein n=1 Tax=Vitreoscilla sp. (strain C1) TaxID=96942 RepID=UPI000CDC9859|nr:hypothetical protein [Vitreoscilla sp. C1]AUZ05265.1 hypothetical protein ADP71_17380 [Vitreoscilla sp. C1]
MSDVYSKEDFKEAALRMLVGSDTELAERVAMGDVFVIEHIGAIAQMLAMLSSQIGLGETEFWTKARDSMVLADAAARQIFPYGTASKYRFAIHNPQDMATTIHAGRRLLDNRNRTWMVTDGVVVPAKGQAYVEAEQLDEMHFVHTVTEYESFYQIALPQPADNQFLLNVQVNDVAGALFEHVERFSNVLKGQKVWHLHGNEIMDLFVTFGLKDKFGYVPQVGEQIKVTLRYTHGDVVLKQDSELSLEYVQAGEEYLSIYADSQIQAGSDAPNITELREITRYPSIYDENAVYLGEFQALIERKHSPFVFLSVWNEIREEQARGANVNNINKLFVSFIKSGINTTAMQTQIKNTVFMADDSYQLVFVPAVEQAIHIQVALQLKSMYDEGDVSQQIKLWLLNQYGRDSLWAKRGGQRINNRNTVRELTKAIAQFADGGSDLSMVIEQPQNHLPEVFQYVSAASISITNTPI